MKHVKKKGEEGGEPERFLVYQSKGASGERYFFMKKIAAHISRLRCCHGTPLSVRFQAVELHGNGAIFIIYIKFVAYFNKFR